tara:strand:- start:1237 stop:2661 length:1425 start_codon:yes stop_codon:yes gene_type:complete
MAENSVLEQALLEAKQLEEAVKSNAKEILASTMKQEIEELVKESLQEDVEDLEINDEEEVDDLEDLDMEDVEDMLDMSDEVEGPDSEDEMVSIAMVDDFEDTLDLTGASDDEVMKVFKAMGSDDGVIVTQDDDTINIEDQEAGTEYRVELNETDEEMEETMDDDIDVMEMDDMDEMDMEMDEMDDETIYEIEIDEDQPYGGNKGDESRSRRDYSERAKYGGNKGDESRSKRDYSERAKYGGNKGDESRSKRDYAERAKYGGNKGDESMSRRDYSERAKYGGNKGDESRSRKDYGEASRTLGFGRRGTNGYAPKGQSYKPVTNNRNLRESVSSLNKRLKKQELVLESLKNENQNYKNKNKDYKKALTMFRDKINEVAVFNANLAYSTKLFTEHTTSKQEKINVLRRFDNVETLTESKGLYKQLNNELSVKTKSITESVQKTISKSPKKGSSTNLIESKTYVNPQIARMKDIMAKL